MRLKGAECYPSKKKDRGQQQEVLTLFTLGELMLLLLSFPFPVSCSFTATSWD
jgi:hypothetical protein